MTKHKKHSGKSEKGGKKKKKLKDKKKHKRARRESSSSSSSSSTGSEQNVWVEKKVSPSVQESTQKKESPKREEWMSLNTLFPCISNMSNEDKKKSRKIEENSIMAKPGQSSKELNPYWKNGGSGLPQEDTVKESTEKIMDPNWLKKSLHRAKEQAAREGRSLEEVAAERWGSLEAIQSMIIKAENVSKKDKYKLKSDHDSRQFKYKERSRSKERHDNKQYFNKFTDSKRIRYRSRSRSKSRSRDQDRNRECYEDDDFLKTRQRKKLYKKPMDDDNSLPYISTQKCHGPKKWQKESVRDKSTQDQQKLIPETKSDTLQSMTKDNIEDVEENHEVKILTEAEMNKLGARIVKAELLGNMKLANELKIQLEHARKLAKSAIKSKMNESEIVILTRTDEKGVTRALQPRSEFKESATSNKKKNQPTHASGERVRYYLNDDKYSLKQLFQHEKGRSTNEDDAVFTKIVSKNMDMSDIFEEQISRAQSVARQEDIDRARVINEHKRVTKSLDNCHWCVDSKNMLKHMIVTMNSRICLSLPPHASLTEGHCILTPTQHIACQLQLDEDIWEELKIFQKTLCRMFAKQDKYPVFFEVYKSRHKFPHMKLECIPLPKEIGELAPVYFKKALLECETEWSVNKKIIDLKEKDVRHAVPNGLAYFAIHFANNTGYAHIIEDDRMFPNNFAEEVIGGMLDLDHDLWRKPKRENFDQQREKVLRFCEVWKNDTIQVKTE